MNENKAPKKYYVFSVLVVLALVLVAFIPSSMVYRLRLFDAVGLPEWMAEVIRTVILIATPAAIMATGLMRIFAVSDKNHAGAMSTAAALEGVACVLEITAALVNGNDIFALLGQALTLGGSIACVFFALVTTLTSNGFYHLVVADNQRMLDWNHGFTQLFNEALDSPEARATMREAVDVMIKSQSEKMAGRRLPDPPYAKQGTNGNKQYDSATERAEKNRPNQ